MAPKRSKATKRSRATKRSGHSHRSSTLTCYRCSEVKFKKDSEMESHNRRFHCKDSKQCRRCGTVYRRRRDLKFHKATMHSAKKKKTTAESSKSKAPAECSAESSSNSESSSTSSSSGADVDFERNVDGGGEGIEI